MDDEQILYEIVKRNSVESTAVKKRKFVEIDLNIYISAKNLAYHLNTDFNVFCEIALKNLVWEFEHHKKALVPDPKKLFS
jgi:hypothetical protein